MKYIFLFFIALYQHFLRPIFPSSCVFEPSCSEYTRQAITKYGAIRGAVMGAKRIARCHPWQKNRIDPVV